MLLAGMNTIDKPHRAPVAVASAASTGSTKAPDGLDPSTGEALPPNKKRKKRDLTKDMNRRWAYSDEYNDLKKLYREFVEAVILPHLGLGPDTTKRGAKGSIRAMYQTEPAIRVQLPGDHPSIKLHCDADYLNKEGELNFWLPVTSVHSSNSLQVESYPGKGDYVPFVMDTGEVVRFWGNRCRHYTKANETGVTRVSFDFRVIPGGLLDGLDSANALKGVKTNYSYKTVLWD